MSNELAPAQFDDPRLEDFLEHLAMTNNVGLAADIAHIPRILILRLRMSDPHFDKWFLEAKKMGVQMMEDEAVRRAIMGVERPVYYKGHRVGAETLYSDSLLQFLLTAELPDKYGKQKVDVNANIDIISAINAGRNRAAITEVKHDDDKS